MKFVLINYNGPWLSPWATTLFLQIQNSLNRHTITFMDAYLYPRTIYPRRPACTSANGTRDATGYSTLSERQKLSLVSVGPRADPQGKTGTTETLAAAK